MFACVTAPPVAGRGVLAVQRAGCEATAQHTCCTEDACAKKDQRGRFGSGRDSSGRSTVYRGLACVTVGALNIRREEVPVTVGDQVQIGDASGRGDVEDDRSRIVRARFGGVEVLLECSKRWSIGGVVFKKRLSGPDGACREADRDRADSRGEIEGESLRVGAVPPPEEGFSAINEIDRQLDFVAADLRHADVEAAGTER